MVYCIVPGCKSDSKRKRNLSFHEFPCDEEVRSEWLKAISRKDDKKGSDWVPTQYSRVCGLHFSNESYKTNIKRKMLMKNAVPSIFPTHPTYLLAKETTPRYEIEKVALDIYNLPVVEKTERVEEQSQDFEISGQKTTPRPKIKNVALDVDNHPAVKRIKRVEEQSHDFEISREETTPRHKIKVALDVDNHPVIEKIKRVEEQSHDFEISREENTSRHTIKKVALDVDSHPVVERIKRIEEQTHDFEISRELSSAQTPPVQKYSFDLSRLEKRCLFLNKKLRNKACLLSKTRKKLNASKEKYNSLLKTYKNLLNEYQSLNLDKLNEMNVNNCQRQFLLDQLSLLSKKRPTWSESTIKTCILWYNTSPAGYRFVRDIGFLKLPSKTTLKLSETTLKLSDDTTLKLSDDTTLSLKTEDKHF